MPISGDVAWIGLGNIEPMPPPDMNCAACGLICCDWYSERF
jgi:hypothetical protein